MIPGLFPSVGITGLEPATSRPPEGNTYALNPDENQLITSYCSLMGDSLVDFSLPSD